MLDTAVNVTAEPVHTDVDGVEILTVGCITALTVTVIALEVSANGEAHAALLVITTITPSLLLSAEVVNVVLLVPVAIPFTNH